jgi:hypothetical protein
VALLMKYSWSCDVGVHGGRDMRADCVHAVQSVEDFRSDSGVSMSARSRASNMELTRKCIGLSAIMI